MVNNEIFKTGWLGADEERKELTAFIEDMDFYGEQWYVPFEDIKHKIYAEADLYDQWIPNGFDDYDYVQDASNGCAMINGVARAVWYALQLMKKKGKEVVPFRVMEAWGYMVYHAFIRKDYSYGGCTMIGAMNAINKYGVLPYDIYGRVISDKEMVQLGWNRKQKAEEIMGKYGSKAADFQVKVTIPKTFYDVQACLKAGYAVGYGTRIALRKGKDNFYRISGKANHSMTYAFYRPNYFGNANSYGDNFGWLAESDARKQIEDRDFSCFCIIDIERTRRSAPNW